VVEEVPNCVADGRLVTDGCWWQVLKCLVLSVVSSHNNW
jgi:hypothetical protein